jgi:hypothetical protein
MERHPQLHEIMQRRGMTTKIAEACKLAQPSVSSWKLIPARHAPTVAKLLEMDEADLRPCVAYAENLRTSKEGEPADAGA